MRFLLPLLLLVLAVAPVAGQDGMEERRYFHDWLADCRTDGYCSATAYVNPSPGNGTVADYVLRIGRHAEQTYWEISLSTVASMADAASPFVVNVDGAAETFSGPDEVAAFGALNDFFLLGRKAQAVMDRLAPGRTISFAFVDQEGTPQQAGFSLAGLTASLIWIDEKQGRLGSERVAEAPPVGLDRAPATPAVGPADIPPALLAQHEADTDCQPFGDIANGGDIEIDRELGEGGTLYILPCWSAAYNFGWRAYVDRFGDGRFETVALPRFVPGEGWSATTTLVNYGYDSDTETLYTFGRHRGIGDCGEQGMWQWHESGFRLLEYRFKAECDGGEPGDFPVVYSLEAP